MSLCVFRPDRGFHPIPQQDENLRSPINMKVRQSPVSISESTPTFTDFTEGTPSYTASSPSCSSEVLGKKVVFFYFPSSLITSRMHSEVRHVKEITFLNYSMLELFLIFTVGFKFFYFPSSLIATRMHSEVKEITFYNLFFMPELFLIFTVGFKFFYFLSSLIAKRMHSEVKEITF